MYDAPEKQEGLRERKKRETQQRITEAGMGLFLADGYEATTLDAIAAAAGISRRTFFHYFQSKDDILMSLQSSGGEALCAAVMAAPPDQAPLDAVRDALVKVSAPYQSDEMMAIDRLMRSSGTLLARKQAGYIHQEQALFDALCARWPNPAQRKSLRLVAMASIGAMRLAFDAWREEGGKRPVTALITEMFDALKAEIQARPR
jgi:AcrR family transcriptional regulator